MKASEAIAKLEKTLEGTGVHLIGIDGVQGTMPYDESMRNRLGLLHATEYRTATVTLAIAED